MLFKSALPPPRGWWAKKAAVAALHQALSPYGCCGRKVALGR